MSISIVAKKKKAFDKIQYLFLVKNSQQARNRRKFLNLKKDIDNIIPNDKNTECGPPRSGTR